ncbi:hypothetical protein GALL_123030 [mine drainage metagenome]|uniref:Uncharacterized protein n=1 Tax=mine drainage metagenome TaxID=410659 RepID=A0A1J5SNG6_9ZZZZ
MRNRIAAFIAGLVLLPPLAISLAGQGWDDPAPVAGAVWLPALSGMLTVIVFGILLDTLAFHRAGHSLLRSQRGYLLWNGVAGTATCMLLAYLNLFAGAWFTPADSDAAALLLAALCGTALLPAVLITRLWLAGLPGLVRLSTRRFALTALPAAAASALLLLAALTGLTAGTIWADHLSWLFWASPLLLLVSLQLLWHESTIFSGLAQGDWSRVLLGAASGIAVGGIALAVYRVSGGAIYLVAGTGKLIAGLALFGLLCLQVSDVVAENWRGKKRAEISKKKPFPIPIVTRKDQ